MEDGFAIVFNLPKAPKYPNLEYTWWFVSGKAQGKPTLGVREAREEAAMDVGIGMDFSSGRSLLNSLHWR